MVNGPAGAPGVLRAVKVLDALAAGEPLGASALARLLGLRASSVADLCASLLDEGMVRRQADGTFVLGPRLARWGEALPRHPQLVRLFRASVSAEPTLGARTVTLESLTGAEVLCLASRLGAVPLPSTPRPGMRTEPLASGAGRAILRSTAEEQLVEHVALFRRHHGLPLDLPGRWKAQTAGDDPTGRWVTLEGTTQLSVTVPAIGGKPSLAAVVLHLPPTHPVEPASTELTAALGRVAARLAGDR
jgi:DNA-binding IclR family transcriptional regulator